MVQYPSFAVNLKDGSGVIPSPDFRQVWLLLHAISQHIRKPCNLASRMEIASHPPLRAG